MNEATLARPACDSLARMAKSGSNVSQKWLDVDDVAANLGISSRSVRRILDRGELPHHRVGLRRVKVAPEDLAHYIERTRVSAQVR